MEHATNQGGLMLSVHGHAVLDWIAANPLPPEQIQKFLEDHFGSATRFHTCSRQGLSLEELISFFYEKKKICVRDGFVRIVGEHICGSH